MLINRKLVKLLLSSTTLSLIYQHRFRFYKTYISYLQGIYTQCGVYISTMLGIYVQYAVYICPVNRIYPSYKEYNDITWILYL